MKLVLNKTEQTTTLKRRGKQTVFICVLLRDLIISQGGGHSIGRSPGEDIGMLFSEPRAVLVLGFSSLPALL